jgi:signal transduction histidine kinase
MQLINQKKEKIELSLQRMSFKIGAVILAYTIGMTAIFSIAFILFQNDFKQTPFTSAEGAFYMLDASDAVNIANTSSIQIQTNRVVSISAIDALYTTVFASRLPYMMGILGVIVLISAIVLWSILKSIQGREMRHIVRKLELTGIGGQSIKVDPALSIVYDNIRRRFDENLEDYKRLNVYLSHEQKNTLAILRAQLEIDQRDAYIKSLDVVSNGIDDILTLSETHDPSFESTVDLAMACATVCDSYRTLTDQIDFRFDENANTIIKAKSRWIYRAISNLIDNAVKFGLNKAVHVDVYSQHGTVIVRVSDEGIGIEAEKLEQIFEHSYRVGELKRDGHGIGLSLVRHVCNLCDGFVWVESEKHIGTTFYLAFKEYNGSR